MLSGKTICNCETVIFKVCFEMEFLKMICSLLQHRVLSKISKDRCYRMIIKVIIITKFLLFLNWVIDEKYF